MFRLATLTAAVAFVVALGFTSVAQAADVNLSGWTEETYPTVTGFSDPIWALEGGNLAVKQTVNAQPTVFFSDFNAQGFTIEGVIEVQTTGDDDFIGFALGFEAGDASDTGADYLLVDWKQGSQSFNFNDGQSCPAGGNAPIGLAVSRVTGIPTADEFWQHINDGCNTDGGVVELQRATNLGATGWTDNTPVTFKFQFTATNLKVFVDGTLELDVDGVFPDGPIAFYNFSQANVRYSAFTRETIVKELTSGPDLDTDGEVDIAIQILQTTTTGYDFTITYVPVESDPVNVVIIDTVPAEWDVFEIDGGPVTDTNDAPFKGPDQGDGVGVGCGRSESGLGNDFNVEVERGGKVGKKCSSSTDVLWTLTPSLGLQTLLVDVTTRQSPSGKLKFKPTSCGKLTINDGAQAFEADGDGNLVLRLGGVPGGAIDPINGEPVPIGDPSNSLMLVAVDDLNGGGLVGDGSGDEDQDGLTDADEAFNVGTDPCDSDTDNDGVLDGVDSCPLEGPPNTGVGETLGTDGCIIPAD